MIERWFPCAEVSEKSESGWGSGNTEAGLFPWFAMRPTAQAKAAVICSLLPWPDDPTEQTRLQKLVRDAMSGRYEKWNELRDELVRSNPNGASLLDPFSGRGIIPLEAARLGIPAHGLDYAPLAVLASTLLTDFPFRDWNEEPALSWVPSEPTLTTGPDRLAADLELLLTEVGKRYTATMAPFYPRVDGVLPWAYLWAVTLPCQECGARFPLVGSYALRLPKARRATKEVAKSVDHGQSFYIDADKVGSSYSVVVHDGPPRQTPTLTSASDSSGRKSAGKSAVCPFCAHAHPLAVHRRLVNGGEGEDALLVVADVAPEGGKKYRVPTESEIRAADRARTALAEEPPFGPLLPAVPNEGIPPGNNNIIGPSIYGARTYGDFMCARQTLAFIRLARVIGDASRELRSDGMSDQYVRALTGYAAAVVARKIRRATRGCTLDASRDGVHDIYANQGSITFSYDFVEPGIGDGPGTWNSLATSTISGLRNILGDIRGCSATVVRGSATSLPFAKSSITAVVTDPPYDQMLAYTDSSDVVFAWLKRVVDGSWPELTVTSDPFGNQDKREEIIVKRVRGDAPEEHRDRAHYDRLISEAFREMRRVVQPDGVVTIVFGHGEPEVWQRLLSAIADAGLTMTGSWPANTESGSHQGKANIRTTLTMSCRPVAASRPIGRKAAVEAEIKAEIRRRYPDWDRWGLAPTDMLMAAAGPAMEVVGRYSSVLDARGEPVDIAGFLPLARASVQEAMAVEIDHHPLETFDARTRFALWWVRVYGRDVVAKSELRWQALASSLELAEVRDLVPDSEKGCQFATASGEARAVSPGSSAIDVALGMAAAQADGLDAVAEVIVASGRDVDVEDPYLWAAISFLADRLPDSDADAIAWSRILRNRASVNSATKAVVVARVTAAGARDAEEAQMKLL
jgi:putative DNA methylase